MSNEVFLEPKYVPLKWLLTMTSICITVVCGAFYLGMIVKELDARIYAIERDRDKLFEEFKDRLAIRKQVFDRLDSIDHRLSLIEGRLSIASH